MAKTFKFGENGKWATKTGSSMAYNDQNGNFKPIPFEVTRDSIATRVNKQGLIEVVGNDKLRIDYTDSSNGVALLEPARTNLVTYSEDATQWLLINSTITSNNIISPDGSQNADKFEFTGDGSIRPNVSQLAFTNNYNYSVFIKKGNSSYVTLAASFFTTSTTVGFDLDNEISETGGIIEKYPNEWYRLSLTNNVTGDADRQGAFYIYLPNALGELSSVAGNYAYVWGADIQEASYNTSYIKTSGSTVTRAADVANGAGNAQVFNDSEGVLFANMFIEDNIEDNVNISVSGGVHENDTFKFIYLPSTNELRAELNISPTVNTRITYDNLSLGQYNKIAASFNTSTLKLYVNGFEINSASTNALPSGLNQMNFDRADGVAPFYGKTKEIGVYDAVLTDAELEALTSYTSFTNMANELNLTIK